MFLLKNKNFNYFLLGESISVLGNWSSYVVVPLLLYNINKNPVSIGILMICRFLPNIILPTIIRKIITRFKIINIMKFSDVLRAIFFSLFLFVNNEIYFYLITLALSFGNALFSPGKQSLITKLVKKEEILYATSSIGAINNFFMLIGPTIGGVIFSIFGRNFSIIFNSLTFIISFLLLSLISKDANYIENSCPNKVKINSKKLIKQIFFDKGLLLIIVAEGIGSLAFGALNIFFPIISVEYFNNNKLVLGYMMSFLGGGLLLGNLISKKITKKMSVFKTYSFFTLISSVAFIYLGQSHLIMMSLLCILSIGIGNGIQEVLSSFYIQNSENIYGEITEVFTLSQSFTSLCIILTMAISPILMNTLGISSIMIILGLFPLFISLIMILAENNNNLKEVEI